MRLISTLGLAVCFVTVAGCIDAQPQLPESKFAMLEISGVVAGDGRPPAIQRFCSAGGMAAEASIDRENRTLDVRNADHAGGFGTAKILVWQNILLQDASLAPCLGMPSIDAEAGTPFEFRWGVQGIRLQWTIAGGLEALHVNGTLLAPGSTKTESVAFYVPESSVAGPANFTGSVTLTHLGIWSWHDVYPSDARHSLAGPDRAVWSTRRIP